MGDGFKRINEGVYPGDGVLDPRWTDTQRFVKKTGKWKTDFADVSLVAGVNGTEVETGGGTSLHDVAGWFPGREFRIPVGTEYSGLICCCFPISESHDARPQIHQRTLLIAIQAVAAQIRAMRQELADGDADPEDDVLLEQNIEAAADLERADDIEARTVLNLPPDDDLVAG